MSDYQKYLYDLFAPWRYSDSGVPYPPYNQCGYMDTYFCNFFQYNFQPYDRYFLPIHWTHCYVNDRKRRAGLEKTLKKLDGNRRYFAVSQHDMCIQEPLPVDTIHFGGAGKICNENTIPIPLICSPIVRPPKVEKDIFASFVGSATPHPVRKRLHILFNDHSDFVFFSRKRWEQKVAIHELHRFMDITNRSVFGLCPRGFAPTSFRLYEVMQLGAVPVYIWSRRLWCPYSNELDWKKFCVIVRASNISKLHKTLKSYTTQQIQDMLGFAENIYDKYFSLDAVCRYIVNYLRNEK